MHLFRRLKASFHFIDTDWRLLTNSFNGQPCKHVCGNPQEPTYHTALDGGLKDLIETPEYISTCITSIKLCLLIVTVTQLCDLATSATSQALLQFISSLGTSRLKWNLRKIKKTICGACTHGCLGIWVIVLTVKWPNIGKLYLKDLFLSPTAVLQLLLHKGECLPLSSRNF